MPYSPVEVEAFNEAIRGMEKDFYSRKIDWKHGKQKKGDNSLPVECFQIETMFFTSEMVGNVLLASCLMFDGWDVTDFGDVIRVTLLSPLATPVTNNYERAMDHFAEYSMRVLKRDTTPDSK